MQNEVETFWCIPKTKKSSKEAICVQDRYLEVSDIFLSDLQSIVVDWDEVIFSDEASVRQSEKKSCPDKKS